MAAPTNSSEEFAPQHVLFVVNNYPPRVGGVELHVQNLATALVQQGHLATVVALDADDSESVEAGIRVVRLKRVLSVADVIAFPRPGSARRIGALAKGTDVTVVSTHTRFFPMTWVGQRAAQIADLPTIHTEHGSGFVKGGPWPVMIASRFVDWTWGRRSLRKADRVIGVSEAVTAFVKRLAGVSATVFYNAIDLELWQSERIEREGEPARLVFLGRLVTGKGWDDFLKAGHEVSRERTVELHVLGDGPQRSQVEELASSLGLNNVLVHGNVPPTEVRRILQDSVLVNPTTLSEGFQTSLLEACAVGAQIVSYPVPGLAALSASGAPIHQVPTLSVSALASTMLHAIDLPQAPMRREGMREWGWNRRGQDYVELIESVRASVAGQ